MFAGAGVVLFDIRRIDQAGIQVSVVVKAVVLVTSDDGLP